MQADLLAEMREVGRPHCLPADCFAISALQRGTGVYAGAKQAGSQEENSVRKRAAALRLLIGIAIFKGNSTTPQIQVMNVACCSVADTHAGGVFELQPMLNSTGCRLSWRASAATCG